MPKYVIERDVPGAGDLTDAQLREIVAKISGGLERNGAKNPVAPQLRHRQQSVLRVPRSRRSHRAGTRQAHGPCLQSRLGGAPPDRSLHCGVSASPTATRPPAPELLRSPDPAACPNLPAMTSRCWKAPPRRLKDRFQFHLLGDRQRRANILPQRRGRARQAERTLRLLLHRRRARATFQQPRNAALMLQLLEKFSGFHGTAPAPPHNSCSSRASVPRSASVPAMPQRSSSSRNIASACSNNSRAPRRVALIARNISLIVQRPRGSGAITESLKDCATLRAQ